MTSGILAGKGSEPSTTTQQPRWEQPSRKHSQISVWMAGIVPVRPLSQDGGFHCFDARNRWCLQEHPEATSGIISLKKSCLVSREKTGRTIGPPNSLEGKASLYSCGARELASVLQPLEMGQRQSPRVHACFMGMKQACGRWCQEQRPIA